MQASQTYGSEADETKLLIIFYSTNILRKVFLYQCKIPIQEDVCGVISHIIIHITQLLNCQQLTKAIIWRCKTAAFTRQNRLFGNVKESVWHRKNLRTGFHE